MVPFALTNENAGDFEAKRSNWIGTVDSRTTASYVDYILAQVESPSCRPSEWMKFNYLHLITFTILLYYLTLNTCNNLDRFTCRNNNNESSITNNYKEFF